MSKKENVHLQLTQELESIDADLDKAIDDLTETNLRIDTFLNGEENPETKSMPLDNVAELNPSPKPDTTEPAQEASSAETDQDDNDDDSH
mgnify:CR=1 FL=1|jgi:hypothetical protein